MLRRNSLEGTIGRAWELALLNETSSFGHNKRSSPSHRARAFRTKQAASVTVPKRKVERSGRAESLSLQVSVKSVVRQAVTHTVLAAGAPMLRREGPYQT